MQVRDLDVDFTASYYHTVCLDRTKNSVRINELRIANEDSEKIVIFRLARG
jgi:hypothetical protein